MIIKETYIDKHGRERKDLVHIYSDLGCRLLQVDTGIIYPDSVIDSINARHEYREMTEDLGELPDELKEEIPEEEKEELDLKDLEKLDA